MTASTLRPAGRDRGLSTARAVLSVLSHVAECPEGVSAREVAARLQKSRSTAYHLLASLEAEGFIARSGRGGCYRLVAGKPGAPPPAAPTPHAITPELERALEDGMHELFHRTGRRTCIGVFSREGVALVQDLGRQGLPRMANLEKPLIRRSAHALAVGKLLLAGLEDDALERWVHEHGLEQFTATTITDAARLRDELATTRERGLATDRCEYDVSFASLAVPIVGASGVPAATIAVTVTRAQYTAERTAIAIAMLTVARELNGALVA